MPWFVQTRDPGTVTLSLPSLGQSLESTVVRGGPFLTVRHAGMWGQQSLFHLQATVKGERKQGCIIFIQKQCQTGRSNYALVSEQHGPWRTSLGPGKLAIRTGGEMSLLHLQRVAPM